MKYPHVKVIQRMFYFESDGQLIPVSGYYNEILQKTSHSSSKKHYELGSIHSCENCRRYIQFYHADILDQQGSELSLFCLQSFSLSSHRLAGLKKKKKQTLCFLSFLMSVLWISMIFFFLIFFVLQQNAHCFTGFVFEM